MGKQYIRMVKINHEMRWTYFTWFAIDDMVRIGTRGFERQQQKKKN